MTLRDAVNEGVASCVLTCYRIFFVWLHCYKLGPEYILGSGRYIVYHCRVLLIWLDRLYIWKKLFPLQFPLSYCLVLNGWNDMWIYLAEYPFSQRVILRWASLLCRIASSEMLFASDIKVEKMSHFWCKAAFSS